MNALTEFSHSLRFIATATRYPLKMGAIWPSSPELAKAMADQVDPQIEGPIIELGSGTGSITKALIERGIDESRLILIESHPHFFSDLCAPRLTSSICVMKLCVQWRWGSIKLQNLRCDRSVVFFPISVRWIFRRSFFSY